MNADLHCKIYPSDHRESDHLSVKSKLRVKLLQLKVATVAPKLQYDKHLNDPDLKEKYMDSIKIR